MAKTKTPIISEYDQQAIDFLESTNSKIESKFLYHALYFPDDKYTRDVYAVTMSREGKQDYTFKFGQSVQDSRVTDGNRESLLGPGMSVFDYEKAQGFHTGSVAESRRKEFGVKPTAYDILTCVQKYDVGTFQDFCDDFDCDNDSIKAREVYFKVQEEFSALSKMFTSDELDKMAEIQ